jgi:hypothetical protein
MNKALAFIIGPPISFVVGLAIGEASNTTPFPTAHISVVLLLWAALMIKLFVFTWR